MLKYQFNSFITKTLERSEDFDDGDDEFNCELLKYGQRIYHMQ